MGYLGANRLSDQSEVKEVNPLTFMSPDALSLSLPGCLPSEETKFKQGQYNRVQIPSSHGTPQKLSGELEWELSRI